jgi:Na+/proline symporter
MQRRHGDRIFYKFVHLPLIGVVWLGAIGIAGSMLMVAVTNRIQGGVSLVVIVVAFALVWLGAVSSFFVGVWSARQPPEEVEIMSLRKGPRPTNPVAADAWWWFRVFWWGWLIMMVGMGLLALVVLLFDPWR